MAGWFAFLLRPVPGQTALSRVLLQRYWIVLLTSMWADDLPVHTEFPDL